MKSLWVSLSLFLAFLNFVVITGKLDEYEKFKASLREKHLALVQATKPKQARTVIVAQQPDKTVGELVKALPNYSSVENPSQQLQAGNRTNGDAAFRFYNLTVSLVGNSPFHIISKIHIIRVPKASSSSLSAVARRAVGCGPPGPCCRYPGEPPGSCPMRELFACQEQKKVIGCTDHFPYLWYLFRKDVPTISMMRNPFSRSISGFFYPGIHHNEACSDDMSSCFRQYTRDPKWRNIVVKMLTGDYAYSPRVTCVANTTCRHSLQLALENLPHFTFIGVAEMWELSMAVLHQKLPSLRPDLSEFKMGAEENSVTKGNRVNMKSGYAAFRDSAYERYEKELHEQNAQDAALYRVVVSGLCDDLHRHGLWDHEFVRRYWRERAPFRPEKCSLV